MARAEMLKAAGHFVLLSDYPEYHDLVAEWYRGQVSIGSNRLACHRVWKTTECESRSYQREEQTSECESAR